ncbi:hypothetical protein [uncultured Clostridium sp.]|uniref:hypothetical protein n=1 Tax=uncultured Clostridium sp. TaxID=59620 RepID=UPI002673CB73|nr:hypothetical protein [uncultured Clostridium sp.]
MGKYKNTSLLNNNSIKRKRGDYMIKKLCLSITIIICLILFNTTVEADKIYMRPITPPISSVYKEGFYSFDIKDKSTLTVRLTTNTPTSIMVLNKNQNIEFITNIPFNYPFDLNNITSDKIIGIVGDGEVAISFEKSNS